MGIFDDGYLGALVSGIVSNQKQQQQLILDISSTSDQRSLIRAESSSSSSSPVALSEAVDTVLEGIPSEIFTKTVSHDPPRAEEIDLHEIFDASVNQSSPPFVMEGSHSSSAKLVRQQTMAVGLARSKSQLPSGSLIPDETNTVVDDSIKKQQLSGDLILLPTFSQSVCSSDSLLSSNTWASPKNQNTGSAKNFDPAAPIVKRKESPLSNYDLSSNSKQQGSKRRCKKSHFISFLDAGIICAALRTKENPLLSRLNETCLLAVCRKGQQKRVVCVPMTGGGNLSEVLPSDMWAWRKYGQKPIKGSPYPRGYYRCSSSKGCSARKQVERSRADPSMLLITYTSEHNHAWPAHRNSLAGTTRTKSQDKIRSSSTHATPAVAANSFASSDQAILQQERSPASSHMEVSTIGNAALMIDDGVDHPLVLESATLSSSQDQQLFQDLEELPELGYAAFVDDSLFSYRSVSFDEIGSMGVDPFDIFCWSSSSFQGSEIAGI